MKNRTRSLVLFISTFMLILLSSTVVFAAEVEPAVVNSERFGVLTLIPPLVAIILAFITKNVVISLFIGTLSGCFMVQLAGYNLFGAFVQAFLDFVQRALNSLADPWNAGIVLQVLVIGGVINLISKMGGARAVAEALAKRAKTPRSTQIVTWLLGLFVFFDDYANALIVGPIMHSAELIVFGAIRSFMLLPFGIGGAIVGGLHQVIVVTGVHHALSALEVELISTTGLNPFNAMITCGIVAQGAAAVAVALKTKDKKKRSLYISSAVPAFLGITEPAIFGINLRFIKPFVYGCIGGAVGGMLAGMLHMAGTGMGITAIPGILLSTYIIHI